MDTKKRKGKVCEFPTHCFTEEVAFGCSGQGTVKERQNMGFKKDFQGGRSHYNQTVKNNLLFFRSPKCTALDHSCSWWPDVSYTGINILSVFSGAINHSEFKWEELQN